MFAGVRDRRAGTAPSEPAGRGAARRGARRRTAAGHRPRPAAAAEAGAELAFVCAVDMPLLTVDLIDELAGPAVRLGADVVLPWDGRDHYLAGIYRTALADHVDGLVAAGERSMRALVDTVDTQRIVMPEQRVVDQRQHRSRPQRRNSAANSLANSRYNNARNSPFTWRYSLQSIVHELPRDKPRLVGTCGR